MKYSNTAITQLTRWYKQILIKCAIINAAILMGGAFVAAPAMATDVSSWDDLKAGLQAGSDMVMTDDITVEEGLGVTDKNNTIDMGEHFLSGNGGNTEGFSIFGGSLTLTGSGAIAGMDRTGTGAGIFNVQGGSLSLEDANSSFIFADNTSKRGVIQVWESANPSEATVSSNVHSLVFNNNTSDMGGAIYHEQRYSDSNVVSELNGDIIGFEENHAVAGNGGAVLNVVGNLSILGNENSFTGNTRTGSSGEAKFYKRGGGAVANASGESLHDATMIIGKAGSVNTFSENTSDTNGGAIMNRAVDVDKGANLTINGVSTFSENSADMKGGAIYNMRELLTFAPGEHEAEVTINGESTFTGNTAGQLGGAIYNSGDMTIDNATFTKNKTTAVSYATDEEIPTNEPAQGGAIYNAGSDVVWEGGSDAKFSYNGVLNISNTNFGAEDDATSGNQALQGGAIANAKANGLAGEVTLNNVNFYNNKTLEDTDGGFSSLGGAIWNSGEMTVNGSTTLKGNTAEGYAAEGGAVYNSGDLTFNDAVTFSGNTVEDTDGANGGKGGAISNHDALTFKKMATFTDNKAVGDGQTSGGALYNEDTVDFQKGATFSGNEAMYGGAIFNDGQMASPVLTVTDATFTNNTAGDEGGAIFTLGGTVNINAVNSDVVFSGNTADGQVNDIMNYGGEINLSAASGKTISLEGINGQKAFGDTPTINISGAGNVEVSEYLANHTVNVNEGELHLTTGEENLYKSTVNVADGAIINTIDDVINDYMSGENNAGVINLADGAKVKGDVDFENGVADKYAATSGTIKYVVGNLIGAAANGSKTIQVAGAGSTIDISQAQWTTDNGMTFLSSGAADGSIKVEGFAGGINDAADASANVETVDYTMTADESINTEKTLSNEFNLEGQGTGASDPALTLNANLATAAGAEVTITDMKLEGDGTFQNVAGATTAVKDSNIDVAVNNAGIWVSDPTTYSDKVSNTGIASFDEDTFTGTAELENNGDAYLLNGVTFASGATITGMGDLTLASGTTHFHNTANTNDVYLENGASFDGELVGGSRDTMNSHIDTGLGTVQNADLYVDARLGTTNTIDSFADASGSTVKEINVLGLNYGTADSVDLTIGAGAALDENFAIYGANYYTDYEFDGTTGTLTLKNKLVNTSTIQGTGDTTTPAGDVVLGSVADTTTVGAANAQIALDNSGETATITAANGTVISDGTNDATLKGTAAGLNVAEGITVGTAGTYGINSTGVASVASLKLGGTDVTATAAELNKLHGATVTTDELNYVHGVTSPIQTQLNNKVAMQQVSGVYKTIFGNNNGAQYIDISGVNEDTGDEGVIQVYSGKAAGTEGVLIEARDGGVPSSSIRVQKAAAYYTKDGAAPTANDEIVTLATAKNGIYSGATTIAGAIDTLNTWKTNLATADGAANAVHGSNIAAGTVAKTALASGVQTTLTNADTLYTNLGGVTATAGEINQLHGSGVETADLTKLHNVTASADDLNKLSGNAVTAADFTKLHNVSATAAEINQLAGSGVVTADLTKLHAVTASADDLNKLAGNEVTAADFTKLHGITADAAELNVLDGITASTTELNQLTGSGVVTADLTKLHAVTASADDLNKLTGNAVTAADFTKLHGITADADELNVLDGITASTAELNILHGVTADATELNLLDGMTAVNVDSTAATADKTTLATVSTVKKAVADMDEMSEAYTDSGVTYTSTVAVESDSTANKATFSVTSDDGAPVNQALIEAAIDATSGDSSLLMAADEIAMFGNTTIGGDTTITGDATVGGGLTVSDTTTITKVDDAAGAGVTGLTITAQDTDAAAGTTTIFNVGSKGLTALSLAKESGDVATGLTVTAANVTDSKSATFGVTSDGIDLNGTTIDAVDVDAGASVAADKTTLATVSTVKKAISDTDEMSESYNDGSNVYTSSVAVAADSTDKKVTLGVDKDGTTLAGITVDGGAATPAVTVTGGLNAANGLTVGTTSYGIAADGAASVASLSLGGTAVSATATEINQLHSSGVVKADFEKLHAVTADAAELNVLDGITASTAELNYMDGVTSNVQDQLDAKQGTLTVGNGIDITSDTISAVAGDGTIVVDPAGIKVGTIQTANIANGAVTAAKIAANAVSTAKIQDGAVSTAKLSDGAKNNMFMNATTSKGLTITAGNGSTAANIALNLASTGGLEEDATNGLQIKAGGVQLSMIDPDAITSAEVAAGSTDTDLVNATSLGATRSAMETKLAAGATGYDINAKTLKVLGNDVLSTANVAPNYTYTADKTIADVNAYVSTNGAQFANVASTAGLIKTVMSDKEDWIGQELGYSPKTTDANTVLGGKGFADADGDGKVSFTDAVVDLSDDIDDVLDGTTAFTGFTMTNNASTPSNVTMAAVDDGTFADTSATTFATNATIDAALTGSEADDHTWTGINSFAHSEDAAGAGITSFSASATDTDAAAGGSNASTSSIALNSKTGLTVTGDETVTGTLTAATGVKFGSDTNAMTGTTADKISYTNKGATTLATAKSVYDALGRIDGLVEDNGDGTYTYHTTAGDVTLNYTNLPVGTSVEDVVLMLNTTVGDRNYVTNRSYAGTLLSDGQAISDSIFNVATKLDNVDTIVGPAQAAAATTGQFAGRKIGDDINLVAAVDELGVNMVSLTTDNVFTGENTFKNTNGIHLQNNVGGNDTNLKATANGLTVDRNVEATGFKIAGSAPVVTSIDVDGSGVTSASAAESIMATAATVYNGAENGLYDGTKAKGDTTSTTIKQALTATNSTLNNILIADGSKVDSAKIDVLWNGANTTLSGALGNGIYTSATHVSAGDDLTTAIKKVDVALGADLTTVQTRTTGGLLTTNSANENIGALDAAIGGDVTSTNYVAAANSVNANISALDTQVKQNADDIADINTEIGTYGTIVTKDAAAAFTGSTLADVNAYVTAEAANVADVGTTASVINVLMADKEAWIGQELGYNPALTDANTVLGGEGFTDQDGDGKVSFNDAVVELKADGIIGTASVSSAGYAATDTVKAAVVAIDAALLADETQISANTTNIGTLASLTTDVKTDLVSAINEVDAHADTAQAEIDAVETALGVVNADGTYKPTALNNNMFENGGTAATSLDGALLNLATNTTTMTGASIDDSGNLKVDYSSNNYVADDTNLVTAVGALDAQAKINADKNTVQDTGMGNLASRIGVTYTATDGSVSATDYAYTNYVADGDSLVTAVGKLDNALHTADSNNAKLDADNIFTGHNTFNNANGITIQDGSAGNSTNITATANGLTVDRNVEAAGFKIAGQTPVVTSIDVDGSGVTSAATAANIMATAATVYNGAENGLYDGTKVKGDTTSTTIKQAMSATASALNALTTAAGNEIDSSKVDVQWNSTDSTLNTVLGNGAYTSTNNITAGDSVTTALSSLDAIVGDVANVTNANGNIAGADVAAKLDSIDVNMGDLTALTTTANTDLVSAINEVNAAAGGASAIIDAGIIGAGTAGSIQGQTLGDGTGGTITIRQAFENVNATNVSQNGSMNSLAGLINGGSVNASTGAYTAGTDTLSTNFTAGNLTAAANELLSDITVAAGTYNVISAGAGAGANLQALDAAFTSGAIDAVFNSVTTDSLTIDNAYAITGATTGHLDMGGNTLDNVNGMVLTNGTSDVALTVDGSGNLVADSGFKANSLESVGDLTVGGDASITGDALVGGDLGVTGNASVGGDLDVTGTANVGALEIGATGYGVTSTGAASFDTVDAANGLTIGSANALTSTTAGQLDMGANDLTNVGSIATNGDVAVGGDFSVAGDSTLTGDLTVSGTTSLKDTDVAGDFSITNATDPSKSVTLDVRGITVDGTGVDALQVNGGMLSTDVIASTDGFKVLSTTGVDTYQTVFDIDDNGSITSDVFSTDNTAAGNTVTIGRADDSTATTVKGTLEVTGDTTLDADLTVSGLTTLDPTNGMQFGATGQNVVSIDNDGSAVAANDATALATGATIKAGAEDADYTTVGPNITAATTIGTAINTLDVEIGADADYTTTINGVAGTNTVKTNIDNVNLALGDVSTVDVNGYTPATKNLTDAVSALNDNMEAVLGAVYKADGTYDNTQLAADGFVTGQTDLTASLKNYAANVETATGGTFDAAGAWTATVDNTGGSTSYAYVASADLMDAIDQVASHVGTAADLTSGAAGVANNGVAATNTVNANISYLNASVGDVSTLANANKNLQDALGTKADTVVAALDDLDAAIGDRTALGSSNTAINTGTATSVAGGLLAAGNAIGDMQFTTTRYVATGSDLSDAVRTLDSNLYRVETDLKDLRKEFKNGMASMSAMSALVPNPRATGNTSLSVGTGMYDGHTAVAVGGFHYITDNVLLNAGASWGNANDLAYRMGITWSW